jgi:hypothetical protein
MSWWFMCLNAAFYHEKPFEYFDTDHDGTLTWEEAKKIPGMTMSQFVFCDVKGEGRIDKEEFKLRGRISPNIDPAYKNKVERALYLLENSTQAVILADVFDLNGAIRRGTASYADFFWDDPRFAALNIDENHDGLITEQELRDFVARRRGLSGPSKKPSRRPSG